jgi:hypothetical protein
MKGTRSALTGAFIPSAFLLAGVASACHENRPSSIGPPDSSVVGTYEVVLCRQACKFEDSAAALIRGILVLDSVRIAVPDSQKEYFEVANASWWATDPRDDHPEGACFVLHEPGRTRITSHSVPVVRGLPAVALASWRYRADSSGLVFELYRSPDASFRVRAQLSGGKMIGTARPGGHPGEAEFGVRYVAGQRIGHPDPTLCLRAAPSHWTRDSLR